MSQGAGVLFTCPKCGKKIRAKPELAGKRIRCPGPSCAALIQVPGPAAPLAQAGKAGTSRGGDPGPIPLDKVGPVHLIFQLPEPPPDEHTEELGAPVASVMLTSNVLHELRVGQEVAQELLKKIRTRFTDDARRAADEAVADLRRHGPGVSCYLQPMAFRPHSQIRPLLDPSIDTVHVCVVVAVEDGEGRTVSPAGPLTFVKPPAPPEQEKKKPGPGLLGLLWPFGRGRRLEALVRQSWGSWPWVGVRYSFHQAKTANGLRKLTRRLVRDRSTKDIRVPVLIAVPRLGGSGGARGQWYGSIYLIVVADRRALVALGAAIQYGLPRIDDSGICHSEETQNFSNFDSALAWLKEKKGTLWRLNMKATPP